VALRLIYLPATRIFSWIRPTSRGTTAKNVEILVLRHQLAVAQRRDPQPARKLAWSDRLTALGGGDQLLGQRAVQVQLALDGGGVGLGEEGYGWLPPPSRRTRPREPELPVDACVDVRDDGYGLGDNVRWFMRGASLFDFSASAELDIQAGPCLVFGCRLAAVAIRLRPVCGVVVHHQHDGLGIALHAAGVGR